MSRENLERQFDVSNFIVCLSGDLAQKAAKELQEKPEWRKRDVEALRCTIREDNELHACLDDFFILRFLRAKKFDYENASKLVTNYYFVRITYPEIFQNFTPNSVKYVFDDKILNVLDGVDYYGRRIVLFRAGNVRQDNHNMDEVIRALLLSLELMLCNEAAQVHGVCVIIDLKNVSISHILQHFKPAVIRKAVQCLQSSFPCRLKAIHFINESHLLDAILILLKPFLSEKTRGKMFFHGQNMTLLQQHVDLEILPSDLGGSAEANSSGSIWFESLEKADSYFRYLSSFGYQTTPSRSNFELNRNVQQQGSLKSAFNAYRRMCIDGLNK